MMPGLIYFGAKGLEKDGPDLLSGPIKRGPARAGMAARLARAAMLGAVFLAFFLSGCSWLPKVHLISDPLTKEEHLRLAMTYEKDGELEIAQREYRAAFPMGLAYLGLGNVLYQEGEVDDALNFYRRAWQAEKIPAAANNLAWVLLLEGGSLTEAQEMATLAVSKAKEDGLEEALIDNYQSTLNQVNQAIAADKRRLEKEAGT